MLVLSGGKYDSYCPNRGRLERREAGEENLEVGLHLQPVPLWCSFCLCQSLPRRSGSCLGFLFRLRTILWCFHGTNLLEKGRSGWFGR